MDKNYLPYFFLDNQCSLKMNDKNIHQKIDKMFNKYYHLFPDTNSLVLKKPSVRQDFIKTQINKHNYFLKFDLSKYFISINHQTLSTALLELLQNMSGKQANKKDYDILSKELLQHLKLSSIYPQRGLALGSPLSQLVSNLFLINFDLTIKQKFIRYADDYLIFFNKKQDIKIFVKNQLNPALESHKLKINVGKLVSGKFSNTKVDFLGFEYYRGFVSITLKKINKFKHKIIKICSIDKIKPIKAIIKQINYQLNGFAHYYKSANVVTLFQKLDGFIRNMLRKYLTKSYDNGNSSHRFVLSNDCVHTQYGLKSLVDIWHQFNHKKPLKTEKTNTSTQISNTMFLHHLANIDIRISAIENLLRKKLCNH
jgi:hypothetical protein